MQSLLLYFSGLGITKEGTIHVMGTDGDLIDIASCFSGALDSTSKTRGHTTITLLDGTYSGDDSQSSASISYVGSGSSDGQQPRVHVSSNGNRMLTAIAHPSMSPPASTSGQEPQLQDSNCPNRATHHRSVFRANTNHRVLSSPAQPSGSMSARHFNPNLDSFCALLDRMESTVMEPGGLVTNDVDADVAGAAIASSIEDAVSAKAALTQLGMLPPHRGEIPTMLLAHLLYIAQISSFTVVFALGRVRETWHENSRLCPSPDTFVTGCMCLSTT